MRLKITLSLLAVSFATLAPRSLEGQAGAREYQDALQHLERGDTALAMEVLRELIDAEPDFGRAYLTLGAILTEGAGQVETDFVQRMEAQELLRRAARLLGNDPEALLQYGLLLRKQRMHVDAKRVLDRAWRSAEDRGGELSQPLQARLNFALGMIYQRWWEDWAGLVLVPETAEAVRCVKGRGLSRPDAAVSCPESFAEQAGMVVDLSDLKSDERLRMMEHFRRAQRLDPGHVEAATNLLGHLVDGGEWEEFSQVAAALAEAAPDDPRSHLFVGLGYHERGRSAPAEAAFDRALERMSPVERAIFQDVGELLEKDRREEYEEASPRRRERMGESFFRAQDPLYLTVGNERILEHYSRLAWVELKFSAPASGLRGWETEKGVIWLRYGRPWMEQQCCYGGSGRTDYWSYSPTGPVFVFTRGRGYRKAVMTEASIGLADDMADVTPQFYRPKTISGLHELPLQVFRARGSLPQLTKVEIFGRPPLDSLAAEMGADVEAGVFVFDASHNPMWHERQYIETGANGVDLTYSFELPIGTFHYGVEARLAAPDSIARPAARKRETLQIEGYLPGRFSVSDILLAEEIEARVQFPSRRSDLTIEPSRDLKFEPTKPLHLYFEIYGLTETLQEEGLGRYRAQLEVRDLNEDGFFTRILARWAPGVSRREEEETRVSWERTVVLVDDRTMDFLEIVIPDVEPGDYAVSLQLTDLVSGDVVETLRPFRIVGGR